MALTFRVAGPRPDHHQKVVLQGFWWDYYNDTYRFKWADYLTEMAPRLKSMGIDAVWIPPTPKNKNATNDVGYSPFDQYDLGDKYQKGDVRSRFGSKDEFLRMVAVLHANGIEVIQDVVLNHVDGAGTADGSGGQDPNGMSTSANGGYKTFRYSCFGTPLPETDDSGTAYAQRQGRWSKNYANFHAHLGHNTTSGDMAAPHFGPDFCYGGNDGGSDGYGPLSSEYLAQHPTAYNPAQSAGYSRDQARSWIVWMKKQTGVDGFRWDAVKHFDYATQQDLTYNLKYNAGWANGGNAMFNVGEYVGSAGEQDSYLDAVNGQNGGSEFQTGTFDFGLRGALKAMTDGGDGYNLGAVAGSQQSRRVAQYGSGSSAVYVHRTVPFVNNHDTFRPKLNSNGNYIGWDSGNELGGGHIDPFNDRLSAAYAIALAVDGAPQVFFEDLFNVGNTGKRWSHLATSTTDLPVRSDLENLLWCHQNLNFKDGAYKVRPDADKSTPNHMIIERSARAVVGINNSYNNWQNSWIKCDFAPGTVLKDYSGANGNDTKTVNNDGYVNINTPPCNGTALLGRRGYSVWAPVNMGTSYSPGRATATSQEWEMADDLGDLNCRSLGQGGRLPDNSTNSRLVGKIYVEAGKAIQYELYPEAAGNTRSLTIGLYDLSGTPLSAASGTASAAGSYTPTTTGWVALKVRNTSNTYAGQRCYVKATYTAPAVVNTRTAPAPENTVAIWTGNDNSNDPADCRNWENGIEPSATTDVLVPAGATFAPRFAVGSFTARNLTVAPGATLEVASGSTLTLTGNLVNQGSVTATGTVSFAGTTNQTITGATSFANLTLNNAAGLTLAAPVAINGALTLTSGRLRLGTHDLTLGSAATISGADASHYIQVNNTAASAGSLVRPVATGASVQFPIGTGTSYTPATVANNGVATSFRARVFEGVLASGTSGGPYDKAAEFVSRTWEVVPAAAGVAATLTLQWNAAEEGASVERAKMRVYGYVGGAWTSLAGSAATASAPYRATATSTANASVFSVGLVNQPLPVSLTDLSAQRQGNAVQITWNTASELNNAYFVVEKSANGREFEAVGRVAGQGTSAQPHTYVLRDEHAPGALYYRLRQVDVSGKSTQSLAVFVAAAGAVGQVRLSPNPTTGQVMVHGLAAAPASLTVTSLHGKVLLSFRAASAAEASSQLSAAVTRCPAGVYMITLVQNGQRQHLKLVKE
ncbi:DUF1939 domain-containing protein [Hymenobacter sp. J193]|uniref:alpha-amylase domain-containing protein n=1 Tax=Hymenobacter sp. J193 TaxID=2898429 RepID=UPI002150DFC6|nr:alpha-amylase domain-containing protein [Hymenobacter sp. J193]MCR5887091.1 DUF1939 domain-containing protein [Hymenobacter sp. J193]